MTVLFHECLSKVVNPGGKCQLELTAATVHIFYLLNTPTNDKSQIRVSKVKHVLPQDKDVAFERFSLGCF